MAGIVALVVRSSAADEGFAIGLGLTLLAVLLGSMSILVPLQRQIIGKTEPDEVTAGLRSNWVKGHLGRTAAALTAFGLAVAGSLD